jgi:hypothetical protein
MGLDYDAHHLAREARKLINSRPHRGYLVHLTRHFQRDPDVEQVILNLEKETAIRTVYVSLTSGTAVHKLLNSKTIMEGLPPSSTGPAD